MKPNSAITAFHLITAPIPTSSEVGQAAERWTRDYVARARHSFADTGTDLRCFHPVFSRVVGFACADLSLNDHEFELENVCVAVGNERQCLQLAQRAYADRSRYLLNYTPWGWAPKYLMARSVVLHTADGTAPSPLLGRMIDLCDMLSLGGLVGSPPLHLALEAQGLGSIPRPMPTVAVEQLLAARTHTLLCTELVAALWGMSSLYTRMYLGPAFSVRRPAIPDTEGSPPLPE